jgi:hypothetical protein
VAEMMINTGPIDYRDSLAKISREKWDDLFSKRRIYIHTEFEHGCECVVDWLQEAEQFYSDLGYNSADEMLLERLEIPPNWVRMAAAVLEATGENLSKTELDQAIELKGHGGDRRSEQVQQEQLDNVNLNSKGGNQAEYIKARLKRDHPEIAEELKRGEHRSARAAGIAAGFIKNVPTVRMVEPSKAAEAIVERVGIEFAAQLAIALASLTAES